jgi:non-heme chloroperoxidase
MAARRISRIDAGGGITLDVAAQGPAEARPVVLLHGLSDSRRSFEPLLEALPDTLHAVAPSQRGHGASSKPHGAYGFDAFADDVAALLDALGHERALLLGHSMGSVVARRLAVRHPRRVDGLVLIGAFAGFAGNPGVLALDEDVRQLRDPVDPAFVRGFQEAASTPDLPADFMHMVVEESLRLPAHVWQSLLQSLLEEGPPSPMAPPVPVLLLWGDRDTYALRSDQDALLRAMPGATLTVFAGAGHSPHWERPGAVASALAAFVRGL